MAKRSEQTQQEPKDKYGRPFFLEARTLLPIMFFFIVLRLVVARLARELETGI
jgi:hypothetical protein